MARENAIILKVKNWVREKGGMVYHYPGGSGHAIEGFPDLIVCVPGYGTVLCEMKATGKKPKPHQLARIDEINKSGGHAFWCDSLEDFICNISA